MTPNEELLRLCYEMEAAASSNHFTTIKVLRSAVLTLVRELRVRLEKEKKG